MGWICWIHVLKPTPPQSSPQSKATIAHPNQFLRTHVALQFWRTRHHHWWNEMNITAENWFGSQEVATCNVCLVGWSGTGHKLFPGKRIEAACSNLSWNIMEPCQMICCRRMRFETTSWHQLERLNRLPFFAWIAFFARFSILALPPKQIKSRMY